MQKREVEFDENGKPFISVKLRGYQLLQDPKLNKGSAFTPEERMALQLNGRLPNRVETLSEQVKRCYIQFSEKSTDLQKNIYLNAFHQRPNHQCLTHLHHLSLKLNRFLCLHVDLIFFQHLQLILHQDKQ